MVIPLDLEPRWEVLDIIMEPPWAQNTGTTTVAAARRRLEVVDIIQSFDTVVGMELLDSDAMMGPIRHSLPGLRHQLPPPELLPWPAPFDLSCWSLWPSSASFLAIFCFSFL